MMISLAAGAAILLIAVAGFRSASQIVRGAQVLAMDNASFNSGIMSAFDEADFWGFYTRKDIKKNIGMGLTDSGASQPGSVNLSYPLASFAYSWDPKDPVSFGRGWQEDERMWVQSADNPLTWWTGQSVQEQSITNYSDNAGAFNHSGYYAIFGASRIPNSSAPVPSATMSAPLAVNGVLIESFRQAPISLLGSYYGTVPQWETLVPSSATSGAASTDVAAIKAFKRHNAGWLYNQIRGILNALGPYGAMDYLPENAIMAYIAPAIAGNQEGTDWVGRPRYLATATMTAGFLPSDGGTNYYAYAVPYYRMGWTASIIPVLADAEWLRSGFMGCALDRSMFGFFSLFYFAPPNLTNLITSNDMLIDYSRNVCGMGSRMRDPYVNGNGDMMDQIPSDRWGYISTDYAVRGQRFLDINSQVKSLLGVKPRSWPDVNVYSARFLYRGRFSTQLRVQTVGEGGVSEFRFSCLGSTLRGKRRQMGHMDADHASGDE
jgi:hypothetical protein